MVESRLREARRRVGLSQDELGAKAGVHFTTIAKIERGERRLSGVTLHRIATALSVSPMELLNERPDSIPVRMAPIVGVIAAGNWREAVSEAEDFVPTPAGGVNAFGLRPDGDSMNKVVPPGGIIIVDPDQKDLQDGRLYAMMNGDGETTFKRFCADPPRLEPVSTNPAHQAIALGREPITVIGRVVALQASL